MVDKSKTFNQLKESLEKLVEHYNKLTWNDLDVQWTKVAEYCDNDVIATEAFFNARKADY